MIIKSISYSQSIERYQPTGLKLWNKASIEADLEPGEDVQSKLFTIKGLVEDFLHKEDIKVNQEYAHLLNGEIPVQQIEKKMIGVFAEDIQSCQDIKTLETYKLLIKGKQELEAVYADRLEFFKNK